MKRVLIGVTTAVMLVAGSAPALAQAVQSFHLGAGVFMPKDYAARANDDVWVENLNTLSFDIKDFRGGIVNGEWTLTFNDRVEIGVGTGFYQRTAPSVYRDYVNSNGREIEQDLRLRVIPVNGIVRFLPLGRAGHVQPYVGGGVSALVWRYSEVGEFVDFADNFNVFRDRYIADGTAIGGTVLGGVRMPLGGDVYALNAEFRYQFGKADLGNNGFLADKLDLSGLHFIAGFQIRF